MKIKKHFAIFLLLTFLLAFDCKIRKNKFLTKKYFEPGTLKVKEMEKEFKIQYKYDGFKKTASHGWKIRALDEDLKNLLNRIKNFQLERTKAKDNNAYILSFDDLIYYKATDIEDNKSQITLTYKDNLEFSVSILKRHSENIKSLFFNYFQEDFVPTSITFTSGFTTIFSDIPINFLSKKFFVNEKGWSFTFDKEILKNKKDNDKQFSNFLKLHAMKMKSDLKTDLYFIPYDLIRTVSCSGNDDKRDLTFILSTRDVLTLNLPGNVVTLFKNFYDKFNEENAGILNRINTSINC